MTYIGILTQTQKNLSHDHRNIITLASLSLKFMVFQIQTFMLTIVMSQIIKTCRSHRCDKM